MTRLDIWKARFLLHCSFNALFALERARIIEHFLNPTNKAKGRTPQN